MAAFQERHWLRILWASLIALSTAAAWGYHHASQSELNVFDLLSLWNARHEAGRDRCAFVDPMMVREAEHRLALETAIRRLSVDHRTVLVLHHYADIPAERIAQILEIPVGTVRSRLARGRGAPLVLCTVDDPEAAVESAMTVAGMPERPCPR